MTSKPQPLPKFGEWDVKNPSSADGFTVIFAKARDEKKTNETVTTAAPQKNNKGPPPPSQQQQHNRKTEMESTNSRFCCF
ncbi:protein NOI4 [Cynara cardunculus var. scolymus]|uniref:protein NOI4 n=1 Tax=Cynara cardunculus var. scolymus TaxID=59895 RepID=UPI000D62D230|nr:protein NOI4 [Cynara cardunculus var. scolymus]